MLLEWGAGTRENDKFLLLDFKPYCKVTINKMVYTHIEIDRISMELNRPQNKYLVYDRDTILNQ